MNKVSIVSVWLVLVTAVVVETIVYYQDPGGYATEAVVAILAVATALVTSMFSMGLKDEQSSVRFVLVVPVALLVVLTVAMLYAYPVSF
jgi:hypothetical protein